MLVRSLRVVGLAAAAAAGSARADGDGGRTVGAGIEPAGFAVYPIPTRAAELTYFLSADRVVSLSYARGETEQLLAKHSADLALLRYRMIVGALTHLNVGLGSRKLPYEREAVEIAATEVVAEASLGNRLSWRPLTLGCDWLGVTVPLAKTASTKDYPDDVSEEDRAVYEDAENDIA